MREDKSCHHSTFDPQGRILLTWVRISYLAVPEMIGVFVLRFWYRTSFREAAVTSTTSITNSRGRAPYPSP